MPAQHVPSARQAVQVAAPAAFVYRLLADARLWPLLTPGHLHAERIDFDGVQERLWTWELAPDRLRCTQARRVLDPRARSIGFEQHSPGRPGSRAAGHWSVEPLGPRRSLLTLHQERRGPHSLETAPGAQLDWVRRAAEHWADLDELLFSFEERTYVPGPAEVVHGFLYRVRDWAALRSQVVRAQVRQYQPGLQVATVDSAAGPLGRRPVTVETAWLCFPHAGRILHKDLRSPAPIAAHTGEWSLEPDRHGVTVTASHRVLLRPQAPPAALPQLRRQVRQWLAAATAETMALAAQHARDTARRRP